MRKIGWAGVMIAVLAGVAGVPRAMAQAESTSFQKIRLQAFGMGSYVNPDYGGAKKNAGATLGGDVNFGQLFHRFEPSLELRAVGSVGRVSNQYVYSGGPRVEFDYGRFHPYALATFGVGQINYAVPVMYPSGLYTHDSSMVTTVGGGLDYIVSPRWAVRADLTMQNWKVGTEAPGFSPTAVSLGLRYRFHFHDKTSPF